ncbi:hypothetical protein EPN83_01400 [Patescibacteria group bacterium]|nr:MAG: hypothetical protein EPN83_01400 [Patescibacteria group bacterium]
MPPARARYTVKSEILQKLLYKKFRLPGERAIERAVQSFSPAERLAFWTLSSIFVLSGIGLVLKTNGNFLVEVPERGGHLTEGIIGSPRFVNPVLALSDADRDLSFLVYSGLLRPTPDGELIPDLAERYEISEDGKTYTFFLKPNARFHDGQLVSADDIKFTIEKIQDPAVKSPKRGNWDGVVVEKVSEREIRFTLKQPYAPFLENMTVGILPSHIWKNVAADEFPFSQYNIEPVGSGSYRVASSRRNSAGIPNEYRLRASDRYTLGEPYIRTLTFKFFANESEAVKAYKSGGVESVAGVSPSLVSELSRSGAPVAVGDLPRIFGIFFNQNQAHLFTNKEVRLALDLALDKDKIVRDVLSGYGSVLEGPIPAALTGGSVGKLSEKEHSKEEARALLEKNGWKKGVDGIYEKKTKKENFSLAFSLATGDAPELKLAAKSIQEQWNDLGANVTVLVYETGDLNQDVIRPRRYDALFFGEVVGRDIDLYPFWHSSQRNDPGLNIALYVNSKADKLLETARTLSDREKRLETYAALEKEIGNDRPVVFVYSPQFLYLIPRNIKGITLGTLVTGSERFSAINRWYIETSKVWKIFTRF